MSVKEILQSHFRLNPRVRWVAINDPQPEFRARFGTNRVGKLKDSRFYVTLPALDLAVRQLIAEAGCDVHELRTTSGARNIVYPGFNTTECSHEKLATFVTKLRDIISAHLHG